MGLGVITAVLMLLGWNVVVPALNKREEPEEDVPEEILDFEYMSVREQIKTTSETSEALWSMEQLQTDLSLSDEDDVLVMRLEWIGRDGKAYSYDLFCNGENAASEYLTAIAEQEDYALRKTLAHHCTVLAKTARSRKNGRKNDAEKAGECYEEAMCHLRGISRD